jgi:ketosteroid isomerase-like protein
MLRAKDEAHIRAAKEFYDRLGRLDIEGCCALLTDDAEALFPFSPGEDRTHVTRGREAIVTRLNVAVPRVAKQINFFYEDFIPGLDPDVLVMQCRSRGVRRKGDFPYENEYVVILRFRGDKIACWAEYFDVVKGSGGMDRLRGRPPS